MSLGSSTEQTRPEMAQLLSECEFIRKEVIHYHKVKTIIYDPEQFNNKNSLAPFIGTICDQQINADVAWDIPYHLYQWLVLNGKEFKASVIRTMGREQLRNWLDKHMADKWPSRLSINDRKKWLDNISGYIIRTCEKIELQYGDEPDNVFAINNGALSIPLIYFLLRQFDGIGPKKASMIARDFGKEHSWPTSVRLRLKKNEIQINIDHIHFTEMPIDVHVKRVFQRLGFARYSQPQDFQNLARLIYPDNPGVVDDFIWNLGRNVCKTQPNCLDCSLRSICEYHKR